MTIEFFTHKKYEKFYQYRSLHHVGSNFASINIKPVRNEEQRHLESLEGIMIATTNLTTNLDKAFERRFLYKIRFDKPTVEARSEIWKAMLPTLKKKDARTLAGAFDLSGGEIENIARKYSVAAILSGNDAIDINAIMETCRHERINNTGRPRIGF